MHEVAALNIHDQLSREAGSLHCGICPYCVELLSQTYEITHYYTPPPPPTASGSIPCHDEAGLYGFFENTVDSDQVASHETI